jgi:molecular chaperone HscB
MQDAFDVLGLEPKYSLDATDLERRQRTLLAGLHPNRQPSDANTDRGFAAQGQINDAVRQLRDPVKRAELLLTRAGQTMQSVQTPELLERVFEQREAIEDAVQRRDRTVLSDHVGAARARQRELLSVLAAHFESGPVQSCGISAFSVVLQELRYLAKLIERGEQGLDDIE